MSRNYHGGGWFSHVPNSNGAIAGSGSKYITVTRVPNGRIDAIGMLFECADAGRPVKGPELGGIVPRRSQKGVAANWIVVCGVNLASMLVEGSNGIRCGGKSEVVELDGTIGDCGDEKGIVRFGPGDVVDSVGGVEGEVLGNWAGGVEIENVQAAIAEDSEILGGGDGEAGLVEGAELDGVAIEGGFKDGHDGI